MFRLLNKISADGWRALARRVARSKTRAFFAYVAKTEGRKKKGFTPDGAAPLLEGDELITSNRGKCEALAREYAGRLAASSGQADPDSDMQLEMRPLPSRWEVPAGAPPGTRQAEAHNAIRRLEGDWCAGPDQIPGLVDVRLPSTAPFPPKLIR